MEYWEKKSANNHISRQHNFKGWYAKKKIKQSEGIRSGPWGRRDSLVQEGCPKVTHDTYCYLLLVRKDSTTTNVQERPSQELEESDNLLPLLQIKFVKP